MKKPRVKKDGIEATITANGKEFDLHDESEENQEAMQEAVGEVVKETLNGNGNSRAQKQPDIKFKFLPVKLSDEEMKLKQNELIEAMDKKDSIDGEFDEVKKEYKADLKAQENLINMLRGVLRTGIERREVECVEQFDYDALTVNLMRSDTNEVVEKRAMTSDERQRHLFKDSKAAAV